MWDVLKYNLTWNITSQEFYIHFQSVILFLGLFKWSDSCELLNESDPIKSIVIKYKNHPSVKKIKGRYISINPFLLRSVTPKKVLDVICALDDEKASGGDNPLGILMDDKIFLQVLCKWINDSLNAGFFPDLLKLAEYLILCCNMDVLQQKIET